MNARLAVQVPSSLGEVLLPYDPPEAAESARFCSLIDCFLDIMDIQNTQSHEFKQEPMLAPFKSVNDRRFPWLRNFFLKSFLNSVQQRQIKLTKDAGQKVFI